MGSNERPPFNPSLDQMQEKFLAILVREYGQSNFDVYFDGLTLADANETLVAFETPSEVRRDMIGRNQLMNLKRLWRRHMGPVDRVAIKLRPDVSRSLSHSSARTAAKTDSTAPCHGGDARQGDRRPFFKDISGQFSNAGGSAKGSDFSKAAGGNSAHGASAKLSFAQLMSPVDERNTFDAFAVDASNELACAAARSALQARSVPELIYLHGKSGVGKTHLLNAVALEARRLDPSCRVAYLTPNNIASGCVSAMMSNNTAELHREFLACDFVLIDDVHLLKTKEKTQEQILAIVDACLAQGSRVAVAGEAPPVQLAEGGMNQRLADRLNGGLSVGLQSGGPHLRFDVLKKRLARPDVACTVSEEALEFIVRNFNHSMRETIGGLNQLLLRFGDKDLHVDLVQARETLRDKLKAKSRVYSLEDLLDVTAEVMGVSVLDMQGKARPQSIARARHAFVHCARDVLKESLPRISAALNRDHTTALSSTRRAAALLERDKVFCKQVDMIREQIEI
ncbi:MAG: DnaA/Hda family protein [Pseudomonadota bacterium]